MFLQKIFYLVIFCILFVSAVCKGEVDTYSGNNTVYSITYISSFFLSESDQSPRKEYMRLMVDGRNSSFQSYNEMVLDTLRQNNSINQSHRNKYFSFNKFVIEIQGDRSVYKEEILDREYWYEEKLEHNWKISNEERVIQGYKCKKASLSYGGRLWIAWFTQEIPISAGPYKFNGLPGLIVKLNDDKDIFEFELYSIITKPKCFIGKLYHRKNLEQREKLTRPEFNQFKQYYYSLSLNEKLVLLNTGNSDDSTALQLKASTINSLGNEDEDVGKKGDKKKYYMYETDHN